MARARLAKLEPYSSLTKTSKKLQEIQQKNVVKLSSKHIDYLMASLDLEKHEAIRLLRKNNGDFEKALDQFVLGTDCLGTAQYSI